MDGGEEKNPIIHTHKTPHGQAEKGETKTKPGEFSGFATPSYL